MGGIDAVREIVKTQPGRRFSCAGSMGQQSLVGRGDSGRRQGFYRQAFQPSNVLEAVSKVLG